MQSHGSFSEFASSHQGLVIGGGIILVLVLAGMFMNKNKTLPSNTSATTGAPDLSGLANGDIVYVPTQTNFETINKSQSGVFASNDPTLTTVTTGAVNSPTTTTTTNNPPKVVLPNPVPKQSGPIPQPPVTRAPAPPAPTPKPTTKGLIWDQKHTILGGETLSIIAAAVTRQLRAQGMPGSMSITWNDLYAHNTAVVNQYAQAHGFKTDFYNWIFPGEVITVPRWG
jgi:hypothetical protein